MSGSVGSRSRSFQRLSVQIRVNLLSFTRREAYVYARAHTLISYNVGVLSRRKEISMRKETVRSSFQNNCLVRLQMTCDSNITIAFQADERC